MNIGNVIFIVFLSVAIFSIIAVIGTEAQNNPNLDLESTEMIIKFNYEVNNTYSLNELSVEENNITANSTFDGVDPFARQYLEDKSEIQQKKGVVDKALSLPTLIVSSFGVDNNKLVIIMLGLFFTGFSIFIGLYIYKAIRTGEAVD